jgi:hypothetical protein
VGWTDGDLTTFALVDYAGLADAHLGGKLGTEVSGFVTECELSNGSARITVILLTKNALGFAQSVAAILENDGFDTTATIFGNKTKDVMSVGAAALGTATLYTTFTISAPGAALPDFFDVLNETKGPSGKLKYAPITLIFESDTNGLDTNGTDRCLTLRQNAISSANGKTLVFSIETVTISESCLSTD